MTQASNHSLDELYHPFQAEFLANPYPLYRQLRAQEPIAFSSEVDAWLVTRYSDVRAILSQPDVFSSRDVTRPLTTLSPAAFAVLQQGYPMVPNSIDSDGFQHQRFREALVKGMNPADLSRHEGYIRSLVNRLIDTFIDDGQADLIAQFAYSLPLESFLHLIDIPQKDIELMKQWCIDLVDLLYASLDEERQVACATSYVAFQHYIAAFLEEQSKNPPNNVVGALISHRVGDASPLSRVELISAVTGLLMAGHRTTVDLMGNGLVLLLQEPTRWQELCAQPALIPSAIEEILRYEAPVHALYRVVTCETKVADVTLPEGARLLLVFGSANRDEGQFPVSETFDMHRAPNRHLSFGHGAHYCTGAPLARLEMRIALEALTQRIPGLTLVPEQKLEYIPVLAFRGYQSVKAQWATGQ